jgi:F-type H+-transporting ATPase subunit a
MAAETAEALTPTSYIGHHLTFFTEPLGNGGFWTLNLDTLAVSILIGAFGVGLMWWLMQGATDGVPGRRQAFAEWLFEYVDESVKGIFHGDRNKFVAPAALTVFGWVILMNAMDFLPVDIVGKGITDHINEHGFRIVPTADLNTTFALALTVWALMIGFGIAVKGPGHWIAEQFTAPFGKNPLLWPFNLLFNIVEYVSKPLSHSLRLFGNMYAGEIIFLLLWMWAANSMPTTGGGIAGFIASVVLALGWSIFHLLIVWLQAYIFMMLTIVYINMAHEGH